MHSLAAMGKIANELATRMGLAESEAAEAESTVEQAIARDSRGGADELVYRLSRRLGISRGRALEVAQVTCRAIADSLEADERRQLLARLPSDLAQLFRPSAVMEVTTGQADRLAGTGHTLAGGQPGSTHPLSRSRPGRRLP